MPSSLFSFVTRTAILVYCVPSLELATVTHEPCYQTTKNVSSMRLIVMDASKDKP